MARQRICGVYAITSPSGKFYIGSSLDVHKRFGEHRAMMNTGKHHNRHIQNAANKYGADRFEYHLLTECEPESVRDWEYRAILMLKPHYNLSMQTHEIMSELWRRPDFRERNTRRASEWAKKMWSCPTYRESAKSKTAVMNVPEVRARSLAGRMRYMKANHDAVQRQTELLLAASKRCMSDPQWMEKFKATRSRCMTEQSRDPEFVAKRNAATRKANAKPVLCIETGQAFASVKAACEWLGKPTVASNLAQMAKGNSRHSHVAGYAWRYLKEDELEGFGFERKKILDNRHVNRRQPAKTRPEKPVMCVETGVVFSSATVAAAEYGGKRSAIHTAISRGKKGLGMTWKFVDEVKV